MSRPPTVRTQEDIAALGRRIHELVNHGCEADDPNLISEALSLSSTRGSSTSPEELMEIITSRIWDHNSSKVLNHIITHGLDIVARGGRIAMYIAYAVYTHGLPKEMVEVLLAHGWDINVRSRSRKPLLWNVVAYGDAVTWCLDHGASPSVQGQRSWPDFDINNTEEFDKYLEQHPWSHVELSDYYLYWPPLLEDAASKDTVATFELLRSKGAAMGWRVLHKAVASAVSRETREPTREKLPLSDGELTPEDPLAMVRHLVDNLKLDVNALDCPPGWQLGNFFGRPLHYAAKTCEGSWTCRPVTWFLMDRGADPELMDSGGSMTALDYGKECFRDAVNEWRLMKTAEAGQNIEKARHDNSS